MLMLYLHHDDKTVSSPKGILNVVTSATALKLFMANLYVILKILHEIVFIHQNTQKRGNQLGHLFRYVLKLPFFKYT